MGIAKRIILTRHIKSSFYSYSLLTNCVDIEQMKNEKIAFNMANKNGTKQKPFWNVVSKHKFWKFGNAYDSSEHGAAVANTIAAAIE